MQLDTGAQGYESVYGVSYFVFGTSQDGHRVSGSFSVLRPTKKPTKEDHVAVEDPVLVAKIREARQLLHQEFVTDEDIWRLERAGKLTAFRSADASKSKKNRSSQGVEVE